MISDSILAWHDVNAKHFSNALAEWLSNFIPRLDLFGKHLPGAFAPSKSYFEVLNLFLILSNLATKRITEFLLIYS